jgi:hypothetical protein
MIMRTLALVALASVLATGASAQSLFNNAAGRGTLDATGLGTDAGAPGGGLWSRLQTTQSTFGFGAQASANNRMADDFAVTGPGWIVSSVNLFMYQTNATTVTINAADVGIYSNEGGAPGTLLHTGTFQSAAFTDIYRVTSTGTDTARRVQMLTIAFGNVSLGAGDYWLVWTGAGTSTSGPWQPQITVAGLSQPPGSANAMQSISGGAFAPVVDGGVSLGQDLPFWINGEPVPEPATMAVLGLGVLAAARRRRSAR